VPSQTQCTPWCQSEQPQYTSNQDLARQLLDGALHQAAFQNPDLVSADCTPANDRACKVLPGKWVEFINATCFQLGSAYRGCRAYTPRAQDVIIVPIVGLGDLFVDVIRGRDGGIRFGNRMMAKYVCESGVVP
jgi:hypothetical protein